MSSESILSLASIISDNTSKIHNYLQENNLPTPSFDINGPTECFIPASAAEIHVARVAVIDATEKLCRLTLGPRDYLMSYTADHLISQQAIGKFNIATSFPIHSEATFAQIGEKCGLEESVTRRLLRHAINQDIFVEPREGVVAHNAVSKLLAEDKQLLDFVTVNADEMWQAGSQAVNAMVKFPGSEEPNETGFALANNTNLPIFEYFSQHPERAKRFASSMQSFVNATGYDVSHVVGGYYWDIGSPRTVVDVGGSHGFVSIALAAEYPELKFIVQDLEPVIASANRDVSPRVEFMEYDFFTEQPVKNADIYLFRWIFHNWSDKYCIQILRNQIPALRKGARIVVVDNLLETERLSRWQETRLRSMDLTMMELFNATERDWKAWEKLFKEADPRFYFLDCKKPTGSNLWILELAWDY